MSNRTLTNNNFKTEADLIAAGADKSELLNDNNIYIESLNKTLFEAIDDGDIGGGGGSGANTNLSNLTSPTAVNQSLLPDTTLTRNIGSAGNRFNVLWADQLNLTGQASLVSANLNGGAITNVDDPTNPQDAATKAYVDASLPSAFPLLSATNGGIVGTTLRSTAGNSTGQVTYNSTIIDTHGAFDGQIYTVPTGHAGTYEISFSNTVYLSANATTGVSHLTLTVQGMFSGTEASAAFKNTSGVTNQQTQTLNGTYIQNYGEGDQIIIAYSAAVVTGGSVIINQSEATPVTRSSLIIRRIA